MQWLTSSNKSEKHIDIDISSLESSISDMKFPSMSLLLGVTNSGKTHLMKCIVRHFARRLEFDKIWVFCPTTDGQAAYDWIDQKQIIKEPSTEAVEEVMARQKQDTSNHALFVFDDVIGRISFREGFWDHMAGCMRHYNCSMMFLVQNTMKVVPSIRENSSYIFITKIGGSGLKEIHGRTTEMGNFPAFQKFVGAVCKEYRILRICVRNENVPFFLFKCPAECPFVMGIPPG